MATNHSANGSVPQTSFRVGQVFNPFRLFTGIFIPEALASYPGVSPTAKLAYGRLVRYAGENGRCFPAVNTLAAEIGVRGRRARCCLAELEKSGFIRRDIQPGRTTAYVFLWHQIFSPESPRQKTAGLPRLETAAPPRRSPTAKENHDQETKRKESQSTLQPAVHATPDGPLKNGFQTNSQRVDDDDKHLSSTASPETEFKERLTERHGASVDPNRVLEDVKNDLANVPLAKFLDADLTATTAPLKLTNPHGHYRQLARRIAREQKVQVLSGILEIQTRVQQALAVNQDVYTPICPHCSDGMRAGAEYCDCKTGEARRDLDAYRSRLHGGRLTLPVAEESVTGRQAQ